MFILRRFLFPPEVAQTFRHLPYSSVQPQGTTSQFASGSPSSYPSVSLSSPKGASSQSATIQSSRKQFTSSYGAQSGSSKPFTLQGSTTYGGSLQPQDTTSQFASGSLSSYPSVSLSSLSSPQGASSQSATIKSSRKQFTSSYGSQSGSTKPFTLQGSTTYGGSLQPQDTTRQFASGSLSSYPSISLSSSQGTSSQSATVQSSRKQFTSSYGTQSGSSKPFTLQESITHGGSLKPQDTTRQFASGSLSSYPSVPLFSSCQSVCYSPEFTEAVHLHRQLWHPGRALCSLQLAGKHHLWWITPASRYHKAVCLGVSILLSKCTTILIPTSCQSVCYNPEFMEAVYL
ncbi:uncharacterized protein LOC143722248 [Siphateles boraxobius]|uniref:uncharacterized protein LOC143722248 n=1 Tax=Siphateles boraxobius TaxID=180520 RepID=UPI004062CF0B